MMNIIVAISENNAIGRGGNMPWHLSGDLKFFKKTTMGHTVAMGRKTWESIGCKPLPGRTNIVVSHRKEIPGTDAENVRVISSLDELPSGDGEIFIIGGGEIYRQTISLAERLYITHIFTKIEDADTFFPTIEPEKWTALEKSEIFTDEKTGLKYQFVTYGKK